MSNGFVSHLYASDFHIVQQQLVEIRHACEKAFIRNSIDGKSGA